MGLLDAPAQPRLAPKVTVLHSGTAASFPGSIVYNFDPGTTDVGRRRITVVAHTNGSTTDGALTMNVRWGDHETADIEQVAAFVQAKVVIPAGLAFGVVAAGPDPRDNPKPQFAYTQMPVFDGAPKLSLQFLCAAGSGNVHLEVVVD